MALKCAKLHFSPKSGKHSLKKTEYDQNVWRRFFRNINKNREIEDIPADEMNILICRFTKDINKKDGCLENPNSE